MYLPIAMLCLPQASFALLRVDHEDEDRKPFLVCEGPEGQSVFRLYQPLGLSQLMTRELPSITLEGYEVLLVLQLEGESPLL